ncbi:hypothetical protein CPB83DRAFT_889659 [Crepidotus variabilis]|uniref:Uncharacterized protein n=1 Tax=Crepidotus variabilis TaxID=179855 RepID=A0A9P6ERS3_9AGAR|nr:hypothetical protein CPB83DRAFT_889659 [Crepidotus variabilis]
MTNSLQSRTRQGLNPLSIVLPHPPLPRRKSSLLSVGSGAVATPQLQPQQQFQAGPRTPRSCASPCLPTGIYYPANRKSTDSWNSSNADEMEFDWLPEQVLLLQRTLDALPSHLVTPFNGPIPPSNLLDKIARGVSQAKGPTEWPHSIRHTRVKLLELARAKAKEDKALQEADRSRNVIREEVEVEMGLDEAEGANYSYFHDREEKPVNLGLNSPHIKRPLYRQSSMDFIRPSQEDLKGNASIARLSKRLQRSDRLFPNPSYHPYSRTTPRTFASSSAAANDNPPDLSSVPSLISPSTPSSSTLNTLSSYGLGGPGPGGRVLRRSASSMSTSTTSSMNMSIYTSSSGSAPDPRVQRILRSSSFYGPAISSTPPPPPPKDLPILTSRPAVGVKRAPSYGALAQGVRTELAQHGRKGSGSYPSSDEEEKGRDSNRKKARKVSGAGAGAGAGSSSAVKRPVILPLPSLVPPKREDLAMASTSTSGGSGSSGSGMSMFDSTGTAGGKSSTSCATSVSSSGGMGVGNGNGKVVLKEREREKVKVPPTPTPKTRSKTKSGGTPVKEIRSAAVAASPTPKKEKEKVVKVRSITNTAGLGTISSGSPPLPAVSASGKVVSRKEGKRGSENENENENKRSGSHSATTSPSTSRSQTQHGRAAVGEPRARRPAPMNLQRNPSMFGAELPALPSPSLGPSSLQASASSSSPTSDRKTKERKTRTKEVYTRIVAAHMSMSPAGVSPPATPMSPSLSLTLSPAFISPSAPPTAPTSPMSPASPLSPAQSGGTGKERTLRRVRRLAPARRISFGSLVAPSEGGGGMAGGEQSCLQLGSAFQLG